jgi:hypothetical protein
MSSSECWEDLLTNVVSVAVVLDHVDTLMDELLAISDRTLSTIVIASVAEGQCPNNIASTGEVYKRANRLLHFRCIQILFIEAVRKRIRRQLSNVILVSSQILVEYVFHFQIAEVVRGGANVVAAGESAFHRHVVAVSVAVHSVIHLPPGDGILEFDVVGVARVDGEVVVGRVLDQWIVPAVADEDGFEIDVVGTGELTAVD